MMGAALLPPMLTLSGEEGELHSHNDPTYTSCLVFLLLSLPSLVAAQNIVNSCDCCAHMHALVHVKCSAH